MRYHLLCQLQQARLTMVVVQPATPKAKSFRLHHIMEWPLAKMEMVVSTIMTEAMRTPGTVRNTTRAMNITVKATGSGTTARTGTTEAMVNEDRRAIIGKTKTRNLPTTNFYHRRGGFLQRITQILLLLLSFRAVHIAMCRSSSTS